MCMYHVKYSTGVYLPKIQVFFQGAVTLLVMVISVFRIHLKFM